MLCEIVSKSSRNFKYVHIEKAQKNEKDRPTRRRYHFHLYYHYILIINKSSFSLFYCSPTLSSFLYMDFFTYLIHHLVTIRKNRRILTSVEPRNEPVSYDVFLMRRWSFQYSTVVHIFSSSIFFDVMSWTSLIISFVTPSSLNSRVVLSLRDTHLCFTSKIFTLSVILPSTLIYFI
jgi:hypothetical protein